MTDDELILVRDLCIHYELEDSFFLTLDEMGLVELDFVEQEPYVRMERLASIEKIIRLHVELEVNLEGIDVIFNLLNRIDHLEQELDILRGRLDISTGTG